MPKIKYLGLDAFKSAYIDIYQLREKVLCGAKYFNQVYRGVFLVFVEYNTRENTLSIKEIRVSYMATKNSDEVPYLTYFM